MPSEPASRTLTNPGARTAVPRPTTRPQTAVLLAVAAGGALGGVSRYEIGLAHPTPAGGFPWATWVINVSGSFLLAVIATLVVGRWPPTRYVRPFLGVGFCGGYTTWSTAMTEAVLLTRDHHAPTGIAYLAASLVAGLGAAMTGIWLGRAWPARSSRRPTS